MGWVGMAAWAEAAGTGATMEEAATAKMAAAAAAMAAMAGLDREVR